MATPSAAQSIVTPAAATRARPDLVCPAGVRYARARGVGVLLALNTYAKPSACARWTSALDHAADLGVDAVIVADAGLMRYAAGRHPSLCLPLSVIELAAVSEGRQTTLDAAALLALVMPAAGSRS